MPIEQRNQIQTSVPDHQVLFSFNDDDEAILFSEWFWEQGQKLFEEWKAERD